MNSQEGSLGTPFYRGPFSEAFPRASIEPSYWSAVFVSVRATGDSAVVGGEDEGQRETGQQGRGEMSPSYGRQIRPGKKPAIKVALCSVE